MRLRGTESKQLEEMGEDTDGLISSTSKLRDTIKSLSGVDIMMPDGQTFKSTYDIMKEISKVYNDLADIDKANLLETIAGKHRASDVQSMISNWSQVEKATSSAINAEGSAMKEYKIHMDTIQASLNALKSTWQEFANTFMKASDLKALIDVLKVALDILTQIVDKVGALPLLATGIGIFASKKGGFNLLNTLGNVGMFSKLFNNKEINTTTSSIGNMLETVADSSKGASAGLETVAVGAEAVGTASKGASIGVSLLNGLLVGLVATGISLAIKGLDWYANRAVNASKEANEAFDESIDKVDELSRKSTSLDELINKYEELGNQEKTAQVNSQIAEIQQEINSLIGTQADNIDLVNGKYEEQLNKLKQIKIELNNKKLEQSQDAYKKSKNASAKASGETSSLFGFNNIGTTVDDTQKMTSNDKKVLQALKSINYGRYTEMLSTSLLGDKISLTSDISPKVTKDGIITTKNNGARERKKALEEFKKYLEDNVDSQLYSESSIYTMINDAINKYDEYINKESEQIKNVLNLLPENIMSQDENFKNLKVDSVVDYDKAMSMLKDIVMDNADVKDALSKGLIDEEDIDKSVTTYMSGLQDIGKFHKDWLKQYQKDEKDTAEKVKQYRTYDVVDNLAEKRSGVATYQKIISESNSSTGLTSETIAEVEKLYSNIKGYDASKIFEKTANGIQVNRKELEKLQAQYLKEDLNQNYMELAEMTNEYKSLGVAIANCTDEQEKKDLLDRQETLKTKIEETARLTSQYEALTSAYNKWIIAQNTEDEGAKYDAFAGYLDTLKELNKKGLIGTDQYQSSVQLMSYEDLTGKDASEYQKVYNKQISTISKYFNGQKSGVESFFKYVNKQHPNWAKIENGKWVVDLGLNGADVVAKQLGVSVDLIESILRKSAEFGANTNLSYYENDLQSIVTHAKTANETLKEMGKTTHTFNFDTTSIEEVNKELEEIKELYKNLPKNEDGTINVEAEGAKETITVLNALLRKKQELENNKITVLDIKLNGDKIEKDSEKIVDKLQKLKTNMDEYSINFAIGGDTETFKNNLASVISEIKKTKPEILAKLKLDNEEFTTAINNVNNSINIGAEINQKDVDTIVKYLSGITPTMVADVDVNDKKVKDYQKTTKKAKGEVEWSNNDKKVNNFKNKTQKAKGVIEWFNDNETILNKFSATGIVNWKLGSYNALEKPKSKQVDGSANTYVSGSAYANGKKSGDWSVGVNGKALVGELGAEIKVSNGKWELVGADSAEFVDVKNNDIK